MQTGNIPLMLQTPSEHDQRNTHVSSAAPANLGKGPVGSGRKGVLRREKGSPSAVRRFKRQFHSLRPAGLSHGDVRRLARRGGVKRMAGGIHQEVSTVLRSYLGAMIQDVAALAEYGRRMTVTLADVLLALKRRGTTMYGCGDSHFLDTSRYDTFKSHRRPRPDNPEDWRARMELRAAAARRTARAMAQAEGPATQAEAARTSAAAAAEAAAAQAAAIATTSLTPTRQMQIEELIGHVYGGQPEQDFVTTPQKLLELVLPECQDRSIPACSVADLEAVLGAMGNVVDVPAHTKNGVFQQRTVWITC